MVLSHSNIQIIVYILITLYTRMKSTLLETAYDDDLRDEVARSMGLKEPFVDIGTLGVYIESAIDTIEAYTGTAIKMTKAEAFVPHGEGRIFDLDISPVTAVSGVLIDGKAYLNYDVYGQYVVIEDIISDLPVSIRYTAGLGRNVPSSVKMAIIKLASRALSNPLDGMLITEDIASMLSIIRRV